MRPGSQWPRGVREPTSTSPKMERGDDGRGRGRQSWNMTLDKSPHGPGRSCPGLQVLSSSLGWCERRLSLSEGSDGGAGDCDAGRKIKQENQFPGWERARRTHGSRLREPRAARSITLSKYIQTQIICSHVAQLYMNIYKYMLYTFMLQYNIK